MNKSQKERKIFNSISEEKVLEKNKYIKNIRFLLNKLSNDKSNHQICFFLIKYFMENKFKALSNIDLYNHIINIYKSNPEILVTNSEEKFKNIKFVKASFMKLIKKNKIFKSSSQKGTYELNQKEALLYLNSYSSINLNKIINQKDQSISPSSEPKSIKSKSSDNIHKDEKESNNEKVKKEKNDEEEDEKVKIKKEEIRIKEEDIEIKKEDKIKIKKEEIKIKEENIKEEVLNNNKKDDIFNDKIYDSFYISFSEEGLYEQLQEKIEKLIDNYNKNKIDNNIKFNISGIINKIKKIQNLLNELNKNKESYDKYNSEIEQKKTYMLFYRKIIKLEGNGLILANKIKNNLDNQLQELDVDSKILYDFGKEKHDIIYDQMKNIFNDMKKIYSKARETKINIRKEIIEVNEYFKKSNILLEDNNELNDLVNNLKKFNYSAIEGESITDQFIKKYNQEIEEFEEKLIKEKLNP